MMTTQYWHKEQASITQLLIFPSKLYFVVDKRKGLCSTY